MSRREEILAKVRSVPAIPVARAELIRVLQDPEAEMAEVRRRIEYDPGLTSNVLRLANSASFGGARTVSSIRDAVVRLGTRRLVRAVLTSAVAPAMGQAVKGYDLPAGALWEHSAAVAMGLEALAEVLKIRTPEGSFTAALLHDVGKLVLGTFVEVDAAPLRRLAYEKGMPFDQAEREVLGVDHAEVGAMLLEFWQLPAEVVVPVRWHHDPDAGGEGMQAADLVHAADNLSMACGIGRGAEGLHYRSSPGTTGRLGVRPGQFEAAACRMLGALDELRALFGAPAGR